MSSTVSALPSDHTIREMHRLENGIHVSSRIIRDLQAVQEPVKVALMIAKISEIAQIPLRLDETLENAACRMIAVLQARSSLALQRILRLLPEYATDSCLFVEHRLSQLESADSVDVAFSTYQMNRNLETSRTYLKKSGRNVVLEDVPRGHWMESTMSADDARRILLHNIAAIRHAITDISIGKGLIGEEFIRLPDLYLSSEEEAEQP